MCIVWCRKKNYKIPLIFGCLIVNFPFMAVFISDDSEKTQQPLLCPDVHSNVRHNPMQTARVHLFKLTYSPLMGIYNGVCEI